jgi:hypothetical protein
MPDQTVVTSHSRQMRNTISNQQANHVSSLVLRFFCKNNACFIWEWNLVPHIRIARGSVPTRGGGGTGRNHWGPAVRKGAWGPTMLHFSCLSQQYHYLSIVQINPFRPSPSHSATESQSFRFGVKIFRRSALVGRPKKIFFHQGPSPLSVALYRLRTFGKVFGPKRDVVA